MNFVVLILLGIDYATLWAVLSFLLSFVPNIGFALSMIPPMLLGLLEHGWVTALIVFVAYELVNTVIDNVIGPRFIGRQAKISPLLSFLSVLFWAWLLGPIGAILTPQLHGLREGRTLPWASSLCGACYEACPVKIDIPSILVHLRGRIVRDDAEHGGLRGRLAGERLAMEGLARVFASRRRYEAAQKAGRAGQWPLARGAERISSAPGPLHAWTAFRDLRAVPGEAFRDWWRTRGS